MENSNTEHSVQLFHGLVWKLFHLYQENPAAHSEGSWEDHWYPRSSHLDIYNTHLARNTFSIVGDSTYHLYSFFSLLPSLKIMHLEDFQVSLVSLQNCQRQNSDHDSISKWKMNYFLL